MQGRDDTARALGVGFRMRWPSQPRSCRGRHGGLCDFHKPWIFLSTETTELSCYRGVMFELGNGFAEEPVKWTAPGSQVCAPDEICQETLLLIDVGTWAELEGHTPALGQASAL
jgi:hypothetical protein